MKKQIDLHKNKVEYTLKISKKARRMRLAIYCDGNFVVTIPQSVNQNLIEKFLIKKSNWILDKLEYFRNISETVIFRTTKKDYIKYKKQAFDLVQERVNFFNKDCDFKFNKINIKNQKTRWGSCSQKGNLNFNYKIILLPSQLSDYIIVHELCHLKEFNHSQKFWNLVSQILPNYLELKKELKKSGVKFI